MIGKRLVVDRGYGLWVVDEGGGEVGGVGVGGGESVGFLFVIFLIFFEIFVSAVVFWDGAEIVDFLGIVGRSGALKWSKNGRVFISVGVWIVL